jgi:hypothetical protein
MVRAKYQLFLLQQNGTVEYLMDTTKMSLAVMGKRLSKKLRRPVLAVINDKEGSSPERFQYENGHLIVRVR